MELVVSSVLPSGANPGIRNTDSGVVPVIGAQPDGDRDVTVSLNQSAERHGDFSESSQWMSHSVAECRAHFEHASVSAKRRQEFPLLGARTPCLES